MLGATAKLRGISVQTGGIDDGARVFTREELRRLQNETTGNKGRALPRPLQDYFLEELFA